MTQYAAPAATYLGDLQNDDSPVTRQWLARSIAPSAIAAVMDRDPHQTRNDLLHRMAANAGRPPVRNATTAGKAWQLQPLLEAEFTARHPRYTAAAVGYWRSAVRPWQRCWSHRVLAPADRADDQVIPVIATLTFRTTPRPLDAVGWGPEGGTQIPAHIYDQTQWLLDTLGVDAGYVVAHQQGMDPGTCRVYRLAPDETRISTLRAAAWKFLDEVALA